MTSIFASWTVGAALLFSAIKNMSLIQLVKGEPGPGQPASIVDTANAKAGQGNVAGPPTPNATATTRSGGVAAPQKPEPFTKSGVGTYDGKQVASWIIPWLEKSKAAGWHGTVSSGYRTPAYSESLCQAMCGAPSCSGTCAGRTSNHSGKVYPQGAVDVTENEVFAAIQKKIRSPLKNDLPADRVHFSFTGH